MFSEKLIQRIQEILSKKEGKEVEIDNTSSVSGGSINLSYRLMSGNQSYFLKCNFADRYPGMFVTEEKGVKLLQAHTELILPRVIGSGEVNNTSFLLTNFIEEGASTTESWKDFGRGLAGMHKHTSDKFGLEYDNYIGSLKQVNEQSDSWADFFMASRLQPLIEIAAESGTIDPSTDEAFERFYKEIDSIFPEEPPALLHGDLWSGNYFFTAAGKTAIFDPAVYYGHREIDIAMTRLFGSCDEAFYREYNNHYPLVDGWEGRLKYANLYPLLVHLVLFGRSYLGQIKAVLKPFS